MGHSVNKKQEERDREHVKWCKREKQDEVRKRGRVIRHGEGRRSKPEQWPSESLSKSGREYRACSDLIEAEHRGRGTSVAA